MLSDQDFAEAGALSLQPPMSTRVFTLSYPNELFVICGQTLIRMCLLKNFWQVIGKRYVGGFYDNFDSLLFQSKQSCLSDAMSWWPLPLRSALLVVAQSLG